MRIYKPAERLEHVKCVLAELKVNPDIERAIRKTKGRLNSSVSLVSLRQWHRVYSHYGEEGLTRPYQYEKKLEQGDVPKAPEIEKPPIEKPQITVDLDEEVAEPEELQAKAVDTMALQDELLETMERNEELKAKIASLEEELQLTRNHAKEAQDKYAAQRDRYVTMLEKFVDIQG